MASLYLKSGMWLPSRNVLSHHGDDTTPFDEPKVLTVTGDEFQSSNSLLTATVVTAWTSSDNPSTFDHAQFVADQIVYLQLIGTGVHSVHKVAAGCPFNVPGYGSVFAAASLTVISAEPTPQALTKIVVGNWSGSTARWRLTVVD